MSEIETIKTDIKADIAKAEVVEKSATGWVKTHVAWLIGLGSFAAGLVLMYLFKH